MGKRIFLLLTFIITILSVSFSDEVVSRDAVVTDIGGETTEVSDLMFETSDPYRRQFEHKSQRFYVFTKPFDLAISPSTVMSIKYDGTAYEVNYNFAGEKRNVSGDLLRGEFVGATGFGKFRIRTNKLKQIIFKDPPVITKPPIYDSEIVLKDGSSFRTSNLKIFDKFTSIRSMYFNSKKTPYKHMSNLEFYKGETFLSIPLDNIKTIIFKDEKGKISVTLKNGKKISGKTLKTQDGSIDGFTGICEKGEFYINVKAVKSVNFK